MQSFTSILAASAFLAGVSASPLIARSTCGSAPAGSGSQTPLSQPTGITTASACQAQCEANASCQSFVFGMVNNANQCMLYSVAAASVPKQSSTNLIVYDKACSSVPAVVPTASNPTGANTGSTSSTGGNTGSNTGNTGNNGNNGGNTGGNTGANHKLKARDTCGAAPTSTGSQAPLSTPAGISTAAACQAQCEANASCKSFVFGMVDNVDKCILYAVAASSIPTQTSTNLVAYDKACASVPTQTPTAANPTGANTGTNGGAKPAKN